MNNVVKNNSDNINLSDMQFCQIISSNSINYNQNIQNYLTDLNLISSSSLEYDSDYSSGPNSLNTFSPVSFKSSSSNSSSNSSDSDSTNSLSFEDDENNYWLRPYSTKFRSRLKQQDLQTQDLQTQNTQRQIQIQTQTQTQSQSQSHIQNQQISINFREYIKNSSSEHTSGLDKDCPFIENLIKKRINSCVVGPSSHIAAFLPSTVEIRSCFIPSWKRKGRNR